MKLLSQATQIPRPHKSKYDPKYAVNKSKTYIKKDKLLDMAKIDN